MSVSAAPNSFLGGSLSTGLTESGYKNIYFTLDHDNIVHITDTSGATTRFYEYGTENIHFHSPYFFKADLSNSSSINPSKDYAILLFVEGNYTTSPALSWVQFTDLYLSYNDKYCISPTSMQSANSAQEFAPNFIIIKGSDLATAGTSSPGLHGFIDFDCHVSSTAYNSSGSNPTTTSFSSVFNFNYHLWVYEVSDAYQGKLSNSVVDTEGNTIAQQGNTIAQQGNTIAQQGNSIAQENSDTNKDTNNKITSFFSSFFDNLIGIFVPESGFFSQWFSDLNDFMSDKLGFLWSPFDFFITFLNGVYSGSGASGITFPELTWIDGTVIIPETTIDLNSIGGSDFNELRDKIYFATDIILLGAVIHQFYQKIKLVFEGGSD